METTLQELSQAQQEIIDNILNEPEQSENSQLTPQHGSIKPVGKLNMESLETILTRMQEYRKANPLPAKVENQSLTTNTNKPLQEYKEKPKPPTLRETPEAQAKVTQILYQCFLTMETYSKQPEDFQTINKMFLNFLADKSPNKVIRAFERYVKERTRFPTIADILGIIEGRIKPDKVYYMGLKKQLQRGEYLKNDEYEYIAKYERQVLNDWE